MQSIKLSRRVDFAREAKFVDVSIAHEQPNSRRVPLFEVTQQTS